MTFPATVVAHAKLTLTLKVVGTRPDGYHRLDAEMVSLDLADILTFEPGDGLEIVGGTGAAVSAGDDNLVRKALAAVGRTAQVTLTKRIPAGGGLGGGSSDAAAVLRWAGCDDLELAARLGGDVPFCVRGGRARVQGIGEIVDALPVEETAGREFTLLTPPWGVSTVAVYREWDRMGGPTSDGPNDLERPALAVEPRLAEWRDRPHADPRRQRGHLVGRRGLSGGRAHRGAGGRPGLTRERGPGTGRRVGAPVEASRGGSNRSCWVTAGEDAGRQAAGVSDRPVAASGSPSASSCASSYACACGAS
jgi:4-diphosphocytidyl-2-C-methyl-D-erythritol kinase